MGIHYHPHRLHCLHIESNLSTVFGEDNKGNPLPLIPQTKVNTTLKVEFTGKGNMRLKNVFVQHIYKFAQKRTGRFEFPSEDYHLINAGGNLIVQISGKSIVEISAGVRNLLNVSYIDHLSMLKPLGIPNPGINFFLSVKLNTTKYLDVTDKNK